MSSGQSSCSNGYIEGTMYANYSCSFSETGVVTADNTSKVTWSGYVNYGHSKNYAYSGSTRGTAGYVKVYVNGSLVQSSTAPMDSGMSPGYRIRTLSGTTDAITHNSDGSKSVECYVKIESGSGNYTGDPFVWSNSTGSKDTLKLTTIARASTPSINTYPTSNNTFTLGDTITIHMNRASSSFKHDVVLYYGKNNNQSVTVATGVENNCTYNTANIATQFLADNPNASSLTGKIKVTTKSGSTPIGSKEITYTATIPDTYAPTVTLPTDVIKETALASVGVPDKTIVRYISKKTFKVTVTPKNGASTVQVILKDGANIRYLTHSGTSTTWTGTFDNLETSNLSFMATDSRGKIANLAIPGLSLVAYVRPTIRNAYLTRVNASTGANSELTAYGIYYNGTIGNVTNKMTVKYSLNGGSTTTLPTSAVTYSGNNWNGVALVGTLSPNNSYTAKVTATDAFNQSIVLDISLASVHDTLWVGKNTVRVHDHLIADGDLALEGAAGLESIFDILSLGNGGKNLLPKDVFPSAGKSRTASGLTYITNYDGSLSVNGTMTADWTFTPRYFVWDKETTKAIFTCQSYTTDYQDQNAELITGSDSTFYAGLQAVDADGSSNFDTPKTWDGNGTVPWRIFCGNEELPFLLERHRKYRYFITFKKSSSYSWRYFYPMIREAHIVTPTYQQYIPRVKCFNYTPGNSSTVRGMQIGQLVFLFGTTTVGGTVPFGITFDEPPVLVLGRSAIGHNSVQSEDPNVRLGSITTSNFYVDTNYGSTSKKLLGWCAVGSYSGPDFWR
jgi:hypothetical protein